MLLEVNNTMQNEIKLTKHYLIEGLTLAPGQSIILTERIIEGGNKVDLKTMMNFLVENPGNISEYDIQPIYFKALAAKFKMLTDTAISASRYESGFTNDAIGFKSKAITLDGLMKDWNVFSAANTMSPELMHLKKTTTGLKYAHIDPKSLKIKGINKYSFSDLLMLLEVALNNRFPKDYTEIYDIISNKGVQGNMTQDFEWTDFSEVYPNLMIKRYKNGALQLRGLNRAEADKVVSLITEFYNAR